MKDTIRLVIIVFFMQFNSYAQKCDDFNQGVFDGDLMGIKYVVERYDKFQLEKMAQFEVVYLHTVEKITECENVVKRYKVIQQGKFPKPNMTEAIKVTFYKIEGEKLFYKANIIGTEITLEGYFIKISDEISDDFKKILEKE